MAGGRSGAEVVWRPLLEAAFFEDLRRGLERERRGACVAGLAEGARALLLGLLASRARQRFLLVVPDDAAVEAYQRNLSALASLIGPNRFELIAEDVTPPPYNVFPFPFSGDTDSAQCVVYGMAP